MIKYLYLLTVATVLMADISLMDALKTREIGSGGEKISLSAKDRIKDEKQVELNLPERFDVVAKTITMIGNVKNIPDLILHVDNGTFVLRQPRHLYSKVINKTPVNHAKSIVQVFEDYKFMEGAGKLLSGTFKGSVVVKIEQYETESGFAVMPKTMIHAETVNFKVTGSSNNNGEVLLVMKPQHIQECLKTTLVSYVSFGKAFHNRLSSCSSDSDSILMRSILKYKVQLPINQPQSSQVFIPDEPGEEPESLSIEEANDAQHSTELSTKTSDVPKTQESGTTSHPKPYDVCKDPSFKDDKDFKEYCRKLADNAKLAAQEEAEEKAQEEADAKAEAEYEAEMEKWNREEEEYNRKLKKELDAQTRAWRKAWKAQDKAFNESIARDQAARRAVQAEIAKAHKIVNRFGGDIESQMLAHKKIDKLADLKSINKAKKIKNAIKKQFYDSKQISLQGESEYQNAKANELDKTSKTLKTISDTAITIDKVIALPAAIESMGVEEVAVEATEVLGGAEATEGATIAESSLTKQIGNAIKLKLKDDKFLASTAIPTVQGMATNAIDASQTDGLKGATVSIVKDTVDTIVPFKIGSEVIDQQYRKHKYYGGDGLDVPNGAKYYDKNHYLIKKIKYGDRVYNEKGDDITNGVRRHMLRYQFLVSKIDNDFKKGDINKKINATLDTKDATTQVIEGSGKMWNIGRKVINYYLEKD